MIFNKSIFLNLHSLNENRLRVTEQDHSQQIQTRVAKLNFVNFQVELM